MADTIKGFSIDGAVKLIDWDGGIANKPSVLSGITSEKVTAWDNKQDALSNTDGGFGQRLKAVEDELAAAINFEALKF